MAQRYTRGLNFSKTDVLFWRDEQGHKKFARSWKKKEFLRGKANNNYVNYVYTKCHLATSKCVARLKFTLRAISSGVARHYSYYRH